MPRQRREGRIRKISSRTLFSGEDYSLKKSFSTVMIEIRMFVKKRFVTVMMETMKSLSKVYHLTAISTLYYGYP